VIEVELFVMVLGASNYTFAEATRWQKSEDFIGSIVRGLEFFGGVPEVLVPTSFAAPPQGPTATTRTSTQPNVLHGAFLRASERRSSAFTPTDHPEETDSLASDASEGIR